jgi:hypothetical protein
MEQLANWLLSTAVLITEKSSWVQWSVQRTQRFFFPSSFLRLSVLVLVHAGWPDWSNFRLHIWRFFYGQFFSNVAEIFVLFFIGKSYALISTEMCNGYILGDFLTNSSGHPVVTCLFIKCWVKLTVLGSMLWSQFSAIFGQFLAKNWCFSQKTMLGFFMRKYILKS